MSSLYRCRARVGYRPSGSEQLIVFDERQIQELNVKLKWKPNAAFANADSSTEASVSTNALSASTCSVTISDPYLTGLAWPALFDAASLYTQSNIFSANNILLPPCGEGQDPYTDKCFKYVDSESDGTTSVSKFPFLVLSLWYDVKGTSFGSDFYFRVNGLSISHGARYPSVTIRGQEARSILFNQSLVNISLDEGLPIDKALKDLAEGQGYSVSFCSNTNSDPTKKRILPRTVRYTGVTVDEAIKKVLDSVSGNFLSMPTRDYANKISMCSRGEINQGCSVFYLGKGLYEGYEINGQPELTILALNAESGSNRNNADPYLSEAFKASTYVLGDMVPQKRKKAMEKVKKVAFPGLFEKAPKHVKNAPSTTGYVWREAKPASSNAKSAQVTNEEATKIQKDGLKLFGTAPNGTASISFLSGEVQEAVEGSGRVLIKTKFALQICEKEGSQKCFFRPVFQESTNLSSVKVKPKDKVEISQELGSSTSDKPEFVRFYIMGHNNQLTTINPKIVWEWAFPETEIPRPENSAVASGRPQSQTPAQQQSGGQGGVLVGRVGSTGESTGPHLHVELGPFTQAGGRGQPITAADVDPYVLIGGKPASAWGVYSPYGPRSGGMHYGIDFSGPGPGGENINGQPVTVVGGATIVEGGGRGGFGNAVIIKRPDGKEMILAHLQDKSIPSNIAGLTTSSGGGKSKPTISGSPATQGLTMETSFKGIPRSLRIIPGRTILSFITDYDAWVEEGRPASRDPGVWIPNRFKNWFVNECEYRWREGDLRVQIEAVSAWGTQLTRVPTFTNYLKSMRDSGDAKMTSNYYDYIRSLGGLNWKVDGKDSTELYCPEAQNLSEFLTQGSDSTSPTDVATSFPPGTCKIGDPAKDSIINGLMSAGLKTREALAGALANMEKESGVNFNVHNGSSPGRGCGSTPSRVLGTTGYGLVQWCGSRADDLANTYKCGRNCSLDQQLSFLKKELEGKYKSTVDKMNNSKTPEKAMEWFMREFEVPRDPEFEVGNRSPAARKYFNQIKCDKPS